MKRIIAVVAVGLALTMVVYGCKKRDEGASKSASESTLGQQAPHGPAGPKVEKKIVVPEEVKASWKKVVLVVTDKTSKKSTEYTVNLGSEFSIPGSNLKVAGGEFLPDFRMNEASFTSASNEPNNPGLMVEVYEDGKQIFKGWLYSRFPDMHPFEHEKYGLTLKQGIKG